MFLAAEHFVRAPDWEWFILGYFFLAGLSGGSYVIATLLRLSGDPRDEPAARIGFYASFLLILLCPVLLTADLGAGWPVPGVWLERSGRAYRAADAVPAGGGLQPAAPAHG